MPCGSPAEFHVHAVHIAEHALREDVLDRALCVQLLFVQDDDLIRGGCEQIQICDVIVFLYCEIFLDTIGVHNTAVLHLFS